MYIYAPICAYFRMSKLSAEQCRKQVDEETNDVYSTKLCILISICTYLRTSKLSSEQYREQEDEETNDV